MFHLSINASLKNRLRVLNFQLPGQLVCPDWDPSLPVQIEFEYNKTQGGKEVH